MPPEPPQKNTLKVKIPFASIEAKPICLRNPEALFLTLPYNTISPENKASEYFS